MAMDKEVQYAMIGGGVAAFVSAGLQRYGDPVFAPMMYSATQYAKDLKTAGYLPLVADAGLTEDQIGVKILETTGFTWGSVATGKVAALVGSAHLTATKDTYMAAVGQKVPPYMLPSTIGAGLVGIAAVADAAGEYVEGLSKYRVLEGALGGNLLGYTVARGAGIIAFKAYPSGLDPIALPAGTMQYLDPNIQSNLRVLSERNNQLQSEVNTLRHQLQLGARATGTVQAAVPRVTVTELARNPNEALKQQQFMGDYPRYPAQVPAQVPQNVQFMSKIQQLEKAFL